MDDGFEQATYIEVVSDGVVHRVPMMANQARRWIEGNDAIGVGPRGEPSVGAEGRLIEHHGLTNDPHAERARPAGGLLRVQRRQAEAAAALAE